MLTIDASVYLNSFNENEVGSADSQAFLAQIHELAIPVFAPTLLLVELAAAVSRALDSSTKGLQIAQAVAGLPEITWVALDQRLAIQASRIGSQYRVRGADAVYAAVAEKYNSTLVTLDQQHLLRLSGFLPVKKPSGISFESV